MKPFFSFVLVISQRPRMRRTHRLVGAFVVLTVASASAPLRVQAQPDDGASLMVPDDVATRVEVTAVQPGETPAQKAARADR